MSTTNHSAHQRFPVSVGALLLAIALPTAAAAWTLQQPSTAPAVLATNADGSMSLEIREKTEPFYLIQLTQPLAAAVAEGERVRLSFRARSTSSNPLRAVVERGSSPYEAVAEAKPRLTAEWADYRVEGEALQAYDASGLSARLQCGQQTGRIEIASLRVEVLGPDPAAQAVRAALVPAAIEARIQQVRTGELRVTVRDAAGRLVPEADVRVAMTRSAFLFGCNFFGFRAEDASPHQLAYRQAFTNLLNFATLPFYWGNFEPRPGQVNYARMEAIARWCRDHGLEPKGHPLIWHEVYPAWAPKEPDATIPLLQKRVDDLMKHYQGLIKCWDVLNEANNAPDFENGEGRWIKRDGAPSVVATALGWARAAAGTNPVTLIYNDYNTGPDNEQLIAALRQRNALPDAIGLQSHMHDQIWPLRRVWQTCERFAAFGRPLHFTELTVLSSTNKPKQYVAQAGEWPTTPDGEAWQADYVERLYTLLYSHPAVQAITWWDFSDEGAWRNAPSGLVRKDMSPKPAYDRLRALIRGKWWTEAAGRTDSTGSCVIRGHQGSYRISVTMADGRRKEATAELPIGQHRQTISIQLD